MHHAGVQSLRGKTSGKNSADCHASTGFMNDNNTFGSERLFAFVTSNIKFHGCLVVLRISDRLWRRESDQQISAVCLRSVTSNLEC